VALCNRFFLLRVLGAHAFLSSRLDLAVLKDEPVVFHPGGNVVRVGVCVFLAGLINLEGGRAAVRVGVSAAYGVAGGKDMANFEQVRLIVEGLHRCRLTWVLQGTGVRNGSGDVSGGHLRAGSHVRRFWQVDGCGRFVHYWRVFLLPANNHGPRDLLFLSGQVGRGLPALCSHLICLYCKSIWIYR
jgi:hypothetical protein